MHKRVANFPQKPVQFISDEPSREDSFDTHSDIASAIATAIETNRYLKVIGLLGHWGSGKSTVIRFLTDILTRFRPLDRTYRVFNYDAWLHQNDAPRISFMSSLIGDLQAEGIIDQDTWETKLKLLTGEIVKTDKVETPALTFDAKLLATLAFLFTIGLSLFSFDVIEKLFHPTDYKNAFIFLVASVALMTLPILAWVSRVCWSRRKGAQKLSWFPPLLLNRELERVSTRIERSPEPSSIEFGRTFQDLVRELEQKKIHLVIVIDNIDRISDDEALDIWANIRILFLGTHSASIEEHQSFHPTVILPVDHYAIKNLFKKQGNAGAENSFVDKTFDATFTVTEPVMSDWRNFLKSQIQFALGGSVSAAEVFQIVRLLEKSQEGDESFRRTPRKLNKLVNKIAALWLQWSPHNVHIISVAYYAIYQSLIEESLLTFVLKENDALNSLVDGWQTEICAIHYGVAPEKSAQVLIKRPLFKAIKAGSFEQFERLVEVPGFGDTFAAICSDEEFELDTADSFDFYLNAATLLSELDGATTRAWAKHSWLHLGRLMSDYARFGTLRPKTSDRLEKIVSNLDNQSLTRILSDIRDIAEAQIGPDLSSSGSQMVGETTRFLVSMAEKTTFEFSRYQTKLGTEDLLKVIAKFEKYPELWSSLEVDISEDQFTTGIVKSASNVENSASLYILLKIISDGKHRASLGLKSIDWEPIRATIASAASDPPAQPALQSTVLEILAMMYRIDSEWKIVTGHLADQGHIGARLNEAVEAKRIKSIAAGLALLITAEKPLPDVPNSTWTDVLIANKGLAEEITNSLHSTNGAVIMEALLSEFLQQPSSKSLIRRLIGYQISGNKLGRIYLDRFADDPGKYFQLVPYDMLDQFIERLQTYSNFETTALAAPWSSELHKIARKLRDRVDGEQSDIVEVLASRLESDPARSFLPAIKRGGEPYGIITEFLSDKGLSLGIKSGLAKALISYIAHMDRASKRPVRRWFRLIEDLNPYARSITLSKLAEALAEKRFGSILPEILIRGGTNLLRNKAFRADPNATFYNVLLPLLNNKDGRTVVRNNAKIFDQWFLRVDNSMTTKFEARVKKMATSGIAEQNDFAKFARARWL